MKYRRNGIFKLTEIKTIRKKKSSSSHESKEFEVENIIRCKNKQLIIVTA